MRQMIVFQATDFAWAPVDVEVEVPDGGTPPDQEAIPVAVLEFRGGPSLMLQVFMNRQDAEGIMNAITESEPMRATVPDGSVFTPEATVLPGGMFIALNPEVVGVSVTPPHETEDGLVSHWMFAFQDADGGQVQAAISDAMSVQLIRALADIVHGEMPANGDQPTE
ncbi:MAG: hypothetical protein HYX33_01455 [Actinobacteria bacterium]|nr:hypothetical protein [Actinomycetota bacterium]